MGIAATLCQSTALAPTPTATEALPITTSVTPAESSGSTDIMISPGSSTLVQSQLSEEIERRIELERRNAALESRVSQLEQQQQPQLAEEVKESQDMATELRKILAEQSEQIKWLVERNMQIMQEHSQLRSQVEILTPTSTDS